MVYLFYNWFEVFIYIAIYANKNYLYFYHFTKWGSLTREFMYRDACNFQNWWANTYKNHKEIFLSLATRKMNQYFPSNSFLLYLALGNIDVWIGWLIETKWISVMWNISYQITDQKYSSIPIFQSPLIYRGVRKVVMCMSVKIEDKDYWLLKFTQLSPPFSGQFCHWIQGFQPSL